MVIVLENVTYTIHLAWVLKLKASDLRTNSSSFTLSKTADHILASLETDQFSLLNFGKVFG